MDKGKIEAMATKYSEKFAKSMPKKHRKFCRRGLTHLDATPIVQIHMRLTKAYLFTQFVQLMNWKNNLYYKLHKMTNYQL